MCSAVLKSKYQYYCVRYRALYTLPITLLPSFVLLCGNGLYKYIRISCQALLFLIVQKNCKKTSGSNLEYLEFVTDLTYHTDLPQIRTGTEIITKISVKVTKITNKNNICCVVMKYVAYWARMIQSVLWLGWVLLDWKILAWFQTATRGSLSFKDSSPALELPQLQTARVLKSFSLLLK
jgi:hypothetical protein